MFSMINLKMICWNCRGLANQNTLNHIGELIRLNKPVLVCLVETREDENRTLQFCTNFKRSWEWAAILADNYSREIIVLWKHFVGLITPIAILRLYVHLIISSQFPGIGILSIIYNGQSINAQKIFGMNYLACLF